MIADRHVLSVAGYRLSLEARAESEATGALIIDIGKRDRLLTVRHIAHARRDTVPAPHRGMPRRTRP
jgi:hypothetical protein